jgi:hypothetical protein
MPYNFLMPRSTAHEKKESPNGWVTGYGWVNGRFRKVTRKMRVLTPAQIRRSIKLSAASKRRVDEVVAEIIARRKAR